MSAQDAPRDFGFAEDEQMLRDLARRFLDENLPVTKLRELVAADPAAVYERGEPPSWDEGLWKQIVELGWTGLAVPESAGGIGGKTIGVAALLEEAGRHALPSPLAATVAATFALRELDTEPARAHLARIADGAAATLAIGDAEGRWDPAFCDVEARREGDAWLLSGRAHFVQDAAKAEFFVVSAKLGDTIALAAVETDAPGLELRPDHIHDLTRDQATLHFDALRVGPDAQLGVDPDALRRAWPALLIGVAADLCGTSEWQLQTTVEYAKQRVQFDRPLAFFQAVKHPLVDAMVEIDRARSLLYHAACCIDQQSPDAENAARMAKSAASDAAAFVSDRSVQLHGGIGFTWESDVHLYFKRSLHGQALYGDGAFQRCALAESLIAPIGAD